jgi:hypothetical protein
MGEQLTAKFALSSLEGDIFVNNLYPRQSFEGTPGSLDTPDMVFTEIRPAEEVGREQLTVKSKGLCPSEPFISRIIGQLQISSRN